MQCPLCKNTQTSDYFKDKHRHYLSCLHCGLVFVPDSFLLSLEEEKARYDLHQNSPDNSGYINFLNKLVTPVCLKVKKGSSGLDFGSGPEPVLSQMFTEKGYKMDIYDLYYADIPENLEKKYDFITMSEVAEHLRHPGEIFRKLIGLLNPGGTLAVMTQPLVDRSCFGNWHYKNDLTHICFFSEKSFSTAAENFNCTLEKCGKDVFFIKKWGNNRRDQE